MRVAGAFLSGVGHAGVIGLAAIGPPFLWAPRDAPVPAMVVTLLGPAEFAALAVPPAPAPPVIVRGSEPAAPARPVAMPPPLVRTPEEAPAPATPPPTTLVPSFEATTTLGIDPGAPAALPDEAAGAEGPAEEPVADSGALRAGYAAQVRRAVSLARVYPQVARDRGLEGRVLFQLVLSPEGGLLAAQLLQSSGAMTLDRAALETVRRAKYPPVPAGIEDPRLTVAVEVVFAGSDR